MERPWYFDLGNPFEDIFEESLLSTTQTGLLSDAVRLALRRIQESPFAGTRLDVDGNTVYVAKTSAVTSDRIPSLLIAYTVDAKRRVIQPILVCRPADVVALASVKRAVRNAPTKVHRPRRRVLSPAERTTIPRRAIEGAVRRALKHTK